MKAKKITSKWLKKHKACSEAIKWIIECGTDDPIKLGKIAIKSKDIELLKYCNWGIVRLFNKKQNVLYAIYSAGQCLHYFEDKYPKDDRPRKAIEAAKTYVKNPSAKNKSAEKAAEKAAERAAWSAAESAAESAAWSAAWSAESAARSAESVAWSAESAAWSAESAMYIKILKYGIKLYSKK